MTTEMTTDATAPAAPTTSETTTINGEALDPAADTGDSEDAGDERDSTIRSDKIESSPADAASTDASSDDEEPSNPAPSAEDEAPAGTATESAIERGELAPDRLAPRVEAILVTAEKTLSPARIADTLGIGLDEGGAKPIEAAIEELNRIYAETGRTFRIERVAGGYRLMTLPDFAETVEKQRQSRVSSKLSQAALETLAIVAYRQPITRADIEAIRGVACGEVLRSLLERHLVKIAGRAEEVGRPILYGTTRHFLEVFGLASLKDLPDAGELREP